MFDQILNLLKAPEREPRPDDFQIAVAVLLVEAARMDDHFDTAERKLIERLLSARFDLTPEKTKALISQAETVALRSSQLHPFTRIAVERMSPNQRIRLIEMLWEVVYADGVLDPEEDVLIRRIAGLVYVSDADRVAARQRVLEWLERKPKS